MTNDTGVSAHAADHHRGDAEDAERPQEPYRRAGRAAANAPIPPGVSNERSADTRGADYAIHQILSSGFEAQPTAHVRRAERRQIIHATCIYVLLAVARDQVVVALTIGERGPARAVTLSRAAIAK